MKPQREPVVETEEIVGGRYTMGAVADKIAGIVLDLPLRVPWFAALFIGFLGVLLLLVSITVLFIKGVGIWGINIPVAWAFAITNFVWWIGIGHAGTFISAILLLLKQDWRTSINRFAEAMTLFAVSCAGLFPLLHLGRPWYVYWLLPYPNTMDLWPQFRSPLIWDEFAVFTYLTVSLTFWFIGLLPDLAVLRDRTQNKILQWIFGILALGWRGSATHWARYKVAYLILAGLATPLVISVHSIVAMDFTGALLPGWHSTIFPPYFVAGAIFSGFAMVLTLIIPLRKIYGLQDFITLRHLDLCAKLMLTTGLIVAYGYMIEAFMGTYSDDKFEFYVVVNRALGPYAWIYWILITCNIGVPQFLWFKKVRANPLILFVLSIFINVGMWLERFMIIVTSLHRDFLPSSWKMYYPTFWDYATFVGTLGFFFFLLVLFVRSLPAISISEMSELVHEKQTKLVEPVPEVSP